MNIVTYRKWFYTFSGILVVLSIAAFAVWGLKLGIEFKGGSLVEVEYLTERPAPEAIQAALKDFGAGESIRSTGDKGYLIRMKTLEDADRAKVTEALTVVEGKKVADIKRLDSIGPLLGKEAARKSMVSIVLVLLCIVLFITWAFRQVSQPVSSWKYGVIAIVALVHDVVIPTGVFAALGHFAGFEIDTLFVTALLVILGFSIHDTIVVFDRVRENLKHSTSEKIRNSFDRIVGESVSQTFTRSINTSLTTLLSLVVLYFFGPEATKHFSLALLVGIVAGTYSSIFLGSPLLVTVEKWQRRGSKK